MELLTISNTHYASIPVFKQIVCQLNSKRSLEEVIGWDIGVISFG